MNFPTNASFTFTLLDQTFLLLPQKAIFWQQTNTLLIADIHFGKVNHFRKEGIAVPQEATASDYAVLEEIVNQYPVKEVIFLGDLFHSTANQACDDFIQWLSRFRHVRFSLIKGNHDILPDSFYKTAQLTVYSGTFVKTPFILSHIPLAEKTDYYNLAGHVHPAIKLFGRGKQVISLPCYYFGEANGILPAFGSFTGKAIISPQPGSRVFAIAGNAVKNIQ